MTYLVLDGLTKRYGASTVVDGLTLSIAKGEFVSLLGPSGCGKTTTLQMIAGFVDPTAGSIRLDGDDLLRIPANKRGLGIVFQNYALFPHMTASQNVAFGLEMQRVGRAECADRVSDALKLVGLSHLADRHPARMSGGQQQRVALARALAVEPSILLLDEPFAALDRNLRLDMQIEVKRLQRQLGLTTILVTHDQDEAMSIADRIAVMNKGKVEQFDTPVAIYDQPRTLFVNGFIGTTNLLPGTIAGIDAGVAAVALANGSTLRLAAPAGITDGTPILLSVRPEHLVLATSPTADSWPVEVGLSLPLGSQLVHEARTVDGTALKIVEPRRRSPNEAPRRFCLLAPDARPSLFPRSP